MRAIFRNVSLAVTLLSALVSSAQANKEVSVTGTGPTQDAATLAARINTYNQYTSNNGYEVKAIESTSCKMTTAAQNGKPAVYTCTAVALLTAISNKNTVK